MRYEIFSLKSASPGTEEQEEIIGTVMATNPEEAKAVALETYKEARGKKLLVREAPNKKGVFK